MKNNGYATKEALTTQQRPGRHEPSMH